MIFILPGGITTIRMATGIVPKDVFVTPEGGVIIRRDDPAIQIFVKQKLFLQSNS
jgi:hypothetical protein